MTVSLSVSTDSPDIDRLDRDTQERLVRERFAGVEWEVPRLPEEMRLAPDFVAFPAYERRLRPYITENQSKGTQVAKMFGA
ncbi:hypothetical protein [Nonomuraea sp. NPDC003201]